MILDWRPASLPINEVPMPKPTGCPGAVVTLLLALASPGWAQDTVRAGALVRIGMTCGESSCPRVQGRLLLASDDSIVVQTHDLQLALPVRDIAWIEVGRNRHGVRTGALIGAGFGVVTGVLMAGDVCNGMSIYDYDDGPCNVLGYVFVSLLNGAIWSGVGALVGRLAAPIKWTAVPPASVRLLVRPVPSAGVGVGLMIPLPALRPVHR
jgi:hypothetical protein